MKKSLVVVWLIISLSCSNDNGYPTNYITQYYEDGEIETIFEGSSAAINIIFVGDGYTKYDFEKPSNIYRKEGIENINFLLDNYPYSDFKEYFNAYIIYAISDDEGPNTYPFNDQSTAFNVRQGEYYPNALDKQVLAQYIRKINPNFKEFNEKELVLMSCKNGSGGVGHVGIALFQDNFNRLLMMHEVGHAFAELGDETAPLVLGPKTSKRNYNPPNLDFGLDMNNIKWNHFIGLPNYEMVGTFELGGDGEPQGVWMPELYSLMGTLREPHYNAPSREAIVKKIKVTIGLEYSFEDFIEMDRKWMERIQSEKNYNSGTKFYCANYWLDF